MLVITIAFVFIGIPIAFSSSSDQNGPIVYNTNWNDERNEVITSIESVEIYRTEEAVDAGFHNELAVTYKIKNNSQNSVYTYPEQGKLVIGNRQMNADPTAADKIGGEVLSGAVSEGKVRFQLNEHIDVKTIKDIRLSWSHSDEAAGKTKYDIQVKLDKNN